MEHEHPINGYEMLIPVKAEDLPSLEMAIPFILEFLKPVRINILSGKVSSTQWNSGLFRYVHEDHLLDEVYPDGMTKKRIKALLESRIGDGGRAGWYFQQFLKMGFSLRSDCPRQYLIWDADTIPLKPIPFEENGKCIFYQTYECNAAYFFTLRRLLADSSKDNPIRLSHVKKTPHSFISESMLIQRDVMREWIKKVEAEDENVPFFEKIISAVDTKDLPFCGFSEFETYGNFFAHTFSPENYILDRSVRRFRYGSLLVEGTLTAKRIRQFSSLLDVISFERGHPFGRCISNAITSPFRQRCFLALYQAVRKAIWIRNLFKLWFRWRLKKT